VEALRVVAPTASGLGALSLRMRLEAAAGRVERGDNLADTLDDPLWFGPSLRRAIAVGEAGGDLPDLLERVATAEARRCKLLIDRLTGWLEPAAILTLAVLIGVVVMAAIQPLIRLQEVIR
jgi:type II secretory pathway component PulF